MGNESKRILWVERCQVLSMLLVTLHHSIPHGYAGPQWLLNLLNAIQFPALVCFFLTSGMFAGHWRRVGWAAYMKKRFVRLMTPYFCINLAMLPPRYLAARMMGVTVRLSPMWLLSAFLNPHGQGIMPHLWFLPALLIMSALLPAIDLAVKRHPAVRVATVCGLLILSALPVSWTSLLCLNELRLYLAYFVLGYALAETRGLTPPLTGPVGIALGGLGLLAFSATLIIQNMPLTPFIRMIGGAAFLLAVAGASDRVDSVTKAFRGKTYVIYLLSLCVQNLVEVIGYMARLPWWITATGMFAAGLAVPCAFWLWNQRRPWPRFLRLAVGL